MYKMLGSLLLLAVFILPSASPQNSPSTCVSKSSERDYAVYLKRTVEAIEVVVEELVKLVNVTKANVTQILIDLQTLRGCQAVSGAVQGGQVFMFVAYLVTIAVLCLVKHCNKHRERLAQSEFELLEAKLQSNKAKRRAAAARAKSAPGPSPK